MSSKRPTFQRTSSTKVLELFEDAPPAARSPVPSSETSTSRGNSSSEAIKRHSDGSLRRLSPLGSTPIFPPQPPMSTPPSERSGSRYRKRQDKSPRRMPVGQSLEYNKSNKSPGTPDKSSKKRISRSSTHRSPGNSPTSISDHQQVKSTGEPRKAQSERNLLAASIESKQVRENLGGMTLVDHQEYINRMMNNIGVGGALDDYSGSHDQFADGHDSWGELVPATSKSPRQSGKKSASVRKEEDVRMSPRKSKSSDSISNFAPVDTLSFHPEISDDPRGGRPPARASKSMPKATSERNLFSLLSESQSDWDRRGQSRSLISSRRESSSTKGRQMLSSASEHSDRDRKGQSKSSMSSRMQSSSTKARQMLSSASEHNDCDHSIGQSRSYLSSRKEPSNPYSKVQSNRQMLSSASEHFDPYQPRSYRTSMVFRQESSKSPQPPRRCASSKDGRRTRSVSRDGRRRDSGGGGRRRYDDEGYEKSLNEPKSRRKLDRSKSPESPRNRSGSKDGRRGTRSGSKDGRRPDSDGGRRRYRDSESISTHTSEYDDKYDKYTAVRESRMGHEASKSPEPPGRRSSSRDGRRIRSGSQDGRRRDSDGDRRRYRNSESISSQGSQFDDSYEKNDGVQKSGRGRGAPKSPEPPGRRSSSKAGRHTRSVSRDGRHRDSTSTGRRNYEGPESETTQARVFNGRHEKDTDVQNSETKRSLKNGNSASKSPASSGGGRSRSLSVSRGRRSGSRDGRRRDPDGDRGIGDSFRLDEKAYGKQNIKEEKDVAQSEAIRSSKPQKSPGSLRNGSKSPSSLRRGSKSPKPRRISSKSPGPGRRGSRSMSRSRQKGSKPANIPELSLSTISMSSKESWKESKRKRASSVDAKERRSSRRASREMSSKSDHTDGGGRKARSSRKSSSGDDAKESSKGWKSLQKKLASSSEDEKNSAEDGKVSPGSTLSKVRRGRKADLLSNSDSSLGIESKTPMESADALGKEKMKVESKKKARSKSRERKATSSKSSDGPQTADGVSLGGNVSRRRKRGMERAARALQKWTRRTLQKLAIQRRLTAIQTLSTRFREADFTFQMEHDEKFRDEAPNAAVRIQRMIRRYQSKMTLERLRDDQQRRVATASIRIQTTMRVYLAKMTRQRAKRRKEYEWQRDYEKYKPEKAKYLEFIALQRLTQASAAEELEVVKEILLKLENDFEKERARMVETLEIQKKIWGDVIQKRVEQEQAKKALDEKRGQAGGHLDLDPNTTPEEHIAEMEEENNLMKDWIEKTAAKTKAKEDEGKDLEKANADVEIMFHELNDFAKNKVAEKKELASQQLMLTKMLIPKAAKQSAKATEEVKTEIRSKLMHRRSIYKVLEGVRSSDAYDHELYEQVKGAIQECEEEISSDILEGDKMRELLIGDFEALLEIDLHALNELGDTPSGKAAESGWDILSKGILSNLGNKKEKKEKLTWDTLNRSIHD